MIAKMFASRGAIVYVTGRRIDVLEKATKLPIAGNGKILRHDIVNIQRLSQLNTSPQHSHGRHEQAQHKKRSERHRLQAWQTAYSRQQVRICFILDRILSHNNAVLETVVQSTKALILPKNRKSLKSTGIACSIISPSKVGLDSSPSMSPASSSLLWPFSDCSRRAQKTLPARLPASSTSLARSLT